MWEKFKDKLEWFAVCFICTAIIWVPLTLGLTIAVVQYRVETKCKELGGEWYGTTRQGYQLCVKDGLIIKLGD